MKRGLSLYDAEQELLKDEALQAEMNKRDLALEISQMIKEARLLMGYTQNKLAKLMHTKQTGISRAENGEYLPTLPFLEKMAKALGTYLVAPRFASMYTESVKRRFLGDATSNAEATLNFSQYGMQASFSYADAVTGTDTARGSLN